MDDRQPADRRPVPDGGRPDDCDDAAEATEDAATEADPDADASSADSDEDPVTGATGDDTGAGSEAEGSDDAVRSGAAGRDDPDGGSNVEVMDAGEAEPAEPEWEPPDVDDIPEFEVTAERPSVESGAGDAGAAGGDAGAAGGGAGTAGGGPATDAGGGDPTAGMPNDARAPGATAVSAEGTEAYVAALELCAQLPDDVALPAEAADLVPAAVEAELEQDIQGFAAAEFDNPRPHVDALDFEERAGDIWLRIRMGVPRGDFEDLDPERLRTFALQELEGVL